MLIIGCDFHTRYQRVAMLDNETGELIELRLNHENGEAHKFYRDLPQPVRVGVEATGAGAHLPAPFIEATLPLKRTAQHLAYRSAPNHWVPHSSPGLRRVRIYTCAATRFPNPFWESEYQNDVIC